MKHEPQTVSEQTTGGNIQNLFQYLYTLIQTPSMVLSSE